jgi:integrase
MRRALLGTRPSRCGLAGIFGLGFFQGALLKDPKKVLVQLGQVHAARVMKFTSANDVVPGIAAGLLLAVLCLLRTQRAGGAVNTGLRRGELLQLRWRDLDLQRRMMTVRGEDAKTGQTRHVPLTSEGVRVVNAWRPADPSRRRPSSPSRRAGRLLREQTRNGRRRSQHRS